MVVHDQVLQLLRAPHYRAGALHRLLFGSGYRGLWATPVRVEVLDLGTNAGGLSPERTTLRLSGTMAF